MANNSVVTQQKLQEFYDTKIYDYLNGATHTGCVPLGTILPYFGETAPTHFLICDGTEYAKADYPELAEHLLALTDPTPYEGSDEDHFKVPDLRGEFLRGTGTNSHESQGNGANVGVHQDGTEFPHLGTWHEGSNEQFTVDKRWNPTTNSFINTSQKHDSNVATRVGLNIINNTTSIISSDGSTATYTARPTNTSVTYIIAYRNAYIDLALDSFPIEITQPTDGQLLMYDATAGRWVNGGHKYSTDEHIVGTWIDGKPIYEKTISGGSFSSKGDFSVNHNISNLDEVVYVSNPIWYDNNDNNWTAQSRMYFSGSVSSSYGIGGKVTINSTKLSILNESGFAAVDWSNRTEKIRITIQYTKTTDTV